MTDKPTTCQPATREIPWAPLFWFVPPPKWFVWKFAKNSCYRLFWLITICPIIGKQIAKEWWPTPLLLDICQAKSKKQYMAMENPPCIVDFPLQPQCWRNFPPSHVWWHRRIPIIDFGARTCAPLLWGLDFCHLAVLGLDVVEGRWRRDDGPMRRMQREETDAGHGIEVDLQKHI